MPFARISLSKDIAAEEKTAVSEAVHQSIVEIFKVPEDDLFHIIEELEPHQMIHPKSYLGVNYSGNMVYVQIIAASGRSLEQKQDLYKSIASKISANTSVNITNVIIVLVENDKAGNWSFGQGIAQYSL